MALIPLNFGQQGNIGNLMQGAQQTQSQGLLDQLMQMITGLRQRNMANLNAGGIAPTTATPAGQSLPSGHILDSLIRNMSGPSGSNTASNISGLMGGGGQNIPHSVTLDKLELGQQQTGRPTLEQVINSQGYATKGHGDDLYPNVFDPHGETAQLHRKLGSEDQLNYDLPKDHSQPFWMEIPPNTPRDPGEIYREGGQTNAQAYDSKGRPSGGIQRGRSGPVFQLIRPPKESVTSTFNPIPEDNE